MRPFFVSLVLVVAGLIGAWASHQDADKAELGKDYFHGFGCERCHTIAGRGGNYGPDLTYIGFRKTPQWLDLWLKDPHAWKASTVMPSLHLSDPVREALVAYLSTLKGDAYRLAPPWDHPDVGAEPVRRGETLFNKAGCVGCHGKAGVGGNPNNNVAGGRIPALTMVADGYSRDELIAKIKNGVPHSLKEDPSGPEPMIAMPSWGQVLQDDEIASLADYLVSLKPKTTASAATAASKDDW